MWFVFIGESVLCFSFSAVYWHFRAARMSPVQATAVGAVYPVPCGDNKDRFAENHGKENSSQRK